MAKHLQAGVDSSHLTLNKEQSSQVRTLPTLNSLHSQQSWELSVWPDSWPRGRLYPLWWHKTPWVSFLCPSGLRHPRLPVYNKCCMCSDWLGYFARQTLLSQQARLLPMLSDVPMRFLTVRYLITGFKWNFHSKILGMKFWWRQTTSPKSFKTENSN